MAKNENAHSVLIIASADASDFISKHLDGAYFSPVECVASADAAQNAPDAYDNIIICSKSGGAADRALAVKMTCGGARGVLFIVNESAYGAVCDTLEATGVLVLSMPCSGKTVFEAAMMLRAMNARLCGERSQRSRLEEKIGEERLVSRAKLTLITTLGMSEDEAHRYIEKQAMDMCATRRAVAENILKTYEN